MESTNWRVVEAELMMPFDISELEVRVGSEKPDSGSNGMRFWLVYIRRMAGIKRLNDAFGMNNWQIAYPTDRILWGDKFLSVYCEITHMPTGISRGNVGSKAITKYGPDENTEKSAYTDAFKRACAMWGIGVYLENAPNIITNVSDGNNKKKIYWTRQTEEVLKELNPFNKQYFIEWASRYKDAAEVVLAKHKPGVDITKYTRVTQNE